MTGTLGSRSFKNDSKYQGWEIKWCQYAKSQIEAEIVFVWSEIVTDVAGTVLRCESKFFGGRVCQNNNDSVRFAFDSVRFAFIQTKKHSDWEYAPKRGFAEKNTVYACSFNLFSKFSTQRSFSHTRKLLDTTWVKFLGVLRSKQNGIWDCHIMSPNHDFWGSF